MGHLDHRTDALGLILATFLLLAMFLLAALAAWQWWYIAQLPPNEAAVIGVGIRLGPAVIALMVFFFWMGVLRLAVGRAMVLLVIQRYSWLFGGAVAVVLSILLVALQVLQLGAFRWGIQDEQTVRLGGVIVGLLLFLAIAGTVGYWIASRLDER
jgi:hypothetical protein